MIRSWLIAFAVLAPVADGSLRAANLTAEKVADGVTIKVGDQLFCRYLTRSGAKPIVWPILGPTGKPMTRSYPMENVAGEDQDHVHQRSLWFTHGNVDGIDFWSELPGHGTTEHREFLKVEGGPQAVVKTRNDWLGPDGKLHCRDVRTLVFRADRNTRSIDFQIELQAAEQPVTFKDTKEGSFGLRMAAGLTGKSRAGVPLGGHIVNSHGDTEEHTWGKRAEWVDYYGTIEGEQLGIAVLNHPSSFRYPTYWHVRPYGLFAANPFGVHDFSGAGDGTLTLEPGKSLSLRYQVLLHRGNHESAKVAEAFEKYASED